MPYVRIEITDGATTEQKLQIYKETTEMLQRILNKKPEYTFVVIREIESEDWGHMGTSVALIRQREAAERAAGQAPAASANSNSNGAKAPAAARGGKAAAKPAASRSAAKPTARGAAAAEGASAKRGGTSTGKSSAAGKTSGRGKKT